MMKALAPSLVCVALLYGALVGSVDAVEVRGTGTTALVGSDLTDPENDGNDSTPQGSGFNATFESNFMPQFDEEGAFNVFDNKVGSGDDKWCCRNVDTDGAVWVQATFPQSIRLMAFSLAAGNDANDVRDPDRWKVQGSNDGISFIDIFSYDNPGTSAFSAANQVLLYRAGEDFSPPIKYRTIRFIALSTAGAGDVFQLNEIELFDRVPGAAEIIVNGSCSLGQAINSAQTATSVGGCVAGSVHADRIVLSANRTFTQPLASNEDIFGSRAAYPDINTGIELLRAPGTEPIALTRDQPNCNADPSFQSRHFSVKGSGFLILRDLVLQSGCASRGGAVAVTDGATLIVEGSRFSGNLALNETQPSEGGAIYLSQRNVGLNPTLIVESGAFTQNTAYGNDSAAVGATGQAAGGAIYAHETARIGLIRDATFDENLAHAGNVHPIGGDARGGAIYSGTQIRQMHRVFFFNNQSESGSGASGGANSLGGALYGSVQFGSNWIFKDNVAKARAVQAGIGGAAFGGAIHGGVQSLTHAQFERNRALGANGFQGGSANGGAWQLTQDADALIDITFSANEAVGGDALPSGSGQGGTSRAGALFQNGAVDVMRNITFANNHAQSGKGSNNQYAVALGGAWLASRAARDVGHITVVDNWAGEPTNTQPGSNAKGSQNTTQGGGLYVMLGTTSLNNSVMERNRIRVNGTDTARDCDRAATVNFTGFNRLAAPGNCVSSSQPSDQFNVASGLKTLGDHGCNQVLPDGSCLLTVGLTRTSPAIDGGSCAVSGEDRDANGRVRPLDISNIANTADGCDIGAFEGRDSDGDSAIDVDDNCPTVPNTLQLDGDGDGLGDNCDACFSAYLPRSNQAMTAGVFSSASNGQQVFDLDAENGRAADQGISYAITGGASNIFAINIGSGVVSVSNAASLGGVGTEHNLSITATDCQGSTTFNLVLTVQTPSISIFASGFE